MPLVTTAQFGGLQPNIQGAVAGGLANRQAIMEQANRERLREQAQSQLGTRQRALGVSAEIPDNETQVQAELRAIADNPHVASQFLSAAGIVNQTQKEEAASFASQVLSAAPELQNDLINNRIREIAARGGDPSNTMGLLDQTQEQRNLSLRGLEAAALSSLQRAELPAKQEILDIKREALTLRKSESELRKLDQQLKRETNELKREELKIKLKEKKIEFEQAKKDKEFTQQSSLSEMDNSIGTIGRMLEGKKLEAAAGVEANLPTIAGTQAADFEGMLETLQSQTFLTQIEKMKGMGALSENEGKKLSAAIGSLDIRMKDETLRREINRILATMKTSKARLEKKFDVKVGDLPDGVSEEDITETMRANSMTREQVLSAIRGK